MLRRRLKFANVIALIALFVSFGGGVYAASKINGKKIKNASVAGTKLKADTLTGAQIDESSLGTVPSAQSAESAKRADSVKSAESAETLGGSGPGAFVSSGDVKQMRFDATIPPGDPNVSRTVLQMGPLTLRATCSSGGGVVLELSASSSAANAGFDAGWVRNSQSPETNGGSLGANPVIVDNPESGINNFARIVGTFVYNDSTTTITVPYVIVVGDTDDRCFLTGTATKAMG